MAPFYIESVCLITGADLFSKVSDKLSIQLMGKIVTARDAKDSNNSQVSDESQQGGMTQEVPLPRQVRLGVDISVSALTRWRKKSGYGGQDGLFSVSLAKPD